jgi:hypothetical protein
MLRRTALMAALLASSIVSLQAADEQRTAAQQIASSMVQTQVVDYTHIYARHSEPVAAGVLETISQWLAAEIDLPTSSITPHIELVSSATLIKLRYASILPFGTSAPKRSGMPESDLGQEVLALYDTANEFIYLPHGWTGRSPAEMSVLVHEMVHHLQNRAKLKYSCPQEREKLAYIAQEQWLSHFATSLEKEFGIDPFTLLVKVNCFGG